jgi:hypothetical protein
MSNICYPTNLRKNRPTMRKFTSFFVLAFLAPFTLFLAPGAVYHVSAASPTANAQISPTNAVLAQASSLIAVYGTRPYWDESTFTKGQEPPEAEIPSIVAHLIACESRGVNVKEIDSNGLYSFGELQFQSSTWAFFSGLSGIRGDPMNPNDAVTMAEWAIRSGYLSRWSCARILKIIQT